MNKEELKKYVIAEAKKVLAECGEKEIDEALGGLFKSAEEKAKKFGQDLVAKATQAGKKVGYQWMNNLLRDKFKIKSGELKRLLHDISPLYKTQDASEEYSIRQHMAGGGAGTVFAPTQEGVELNENVSPEQVEKLVQEIKKINKKIDLRNPLLTEETTSIVDSVITEDKKEKKSKEKEAIKENKEVNRWKNLTEYKTFTD